MRKLALTLAGLALIAGPAFAGEFNKKLSIGDKAPKFSGIPAVMKDKETTLDLDSIKEDVVVVVFLGNHCPVVVAYEDRIIDFAKEFEGKSVKVVGVCVNNQDSDRLPAIKARVKEKGYNYVYGYEESGAIGKAYGATRTPEFFVLDKARTIRYMGALDDNQQEAKVKKTYLKDAVNTLLKGESPEVAETRPVGCGINYK
ncbi:MAG: thioredoxin family protein [Isosphaeraceae bacterium]